VEWNRVNLFPLGVLCRFGGWWRLLVLGLGLAGLGVLLVQRVLGSLLLASAAALAWFFRSPRRELPPSGTLVAPADGVVDDVEEIEGGCLLSGKTLRVGIFLSVLDVHATRAPVSARIERVDEVPGGHGSATSRSSGSRNQRIEVRFSDAGGHRLCMRQIAGLIARRVVFGPQPGDAVRAGALVGMIRFGSRVELYVPLRAYAPRVERGMRVRAGETILGVRTDPAGCVCGAPGVRRIGTGGSLHSKKGASTMGVSQEESGLQERLEELRHRAHATCVVCGSENARGLRVPFRVLLDGSVEAPFECAKRLEGYPEVLHGGIVAALLDGAMTNCLFAHGIAALTAELTVRYHHPVAIDREAIVRAWIRRSVRGVYQMGAELRQDGRLAATAQAKFLANGPKGEDSPFSRTAASREITGGEPSHPGAGSKHVGNRVER